MGAQYSGDYYFLAVDNSSQASIGSASSGTDSWAVEGVLVWNPVANLEVRGEVRYTDFTGGLLPNTDATTGLFRLQRNF